MRRLVALLFTVAAISCATPAIKVPAVPAGACQEVYGACVLYAADADIHFTTRQLEQALDVAAKYWQADPKSLKDWVILVHGEWPLVFGSVTLWGVTLPDYRRIDFVVQDPHCPDLVLVHELGHAYSIAQGKDGRPHVGPGLDDPRFDDAGIYRVLRDEGACR